MKSGLVSSWFKGIKGRLLVAAFIPMIGFAAIFTVAMKGLDRTNIILEDAQTLIIPNLDILGEMRQSRNRFGFQVWAGIDSANNPEQLKIRMDSAREAVEEFSTNYKKYTEARFAPGEAEIHDKAKDRVPELIDQMKLVITLVATGDAQKILEAKTIMSGRFAENNNVVRDFNRKVTALYREVSLREGNEAKETQKQVFTLLVAITATSCLAIFALLLWIGAKISNSVGAIADRLSSASGQVTTSVEQLNEAGNSLSQSSTEAAASLEETVAALEELTSMVQMNSDNAKQAAALSATSRDSAEQGEKEIQTLIKSMTKISESSKKIEEIIHVIDDIAFQTNLLALNAAVEAARAGEQGKGFAVVAEAVRSLAQRSAASAKDISSLIKDSVSQIEEGSEVADKSGTVLTNIVNSIKKVSDLNNEIAAASAEQTTGIQQIGKAMNQLDQSSQSNAASAEEIAATSGEISTLAQTSQDLTVELNAVIMGDSAKLSTDPVSAVVDAPKKETKKPKMASASRSYTPPKASVKKSNVVPMPVKKVSAKEASSDIIPFDDDGDADPRAKVGTTDGF